MATDEFDPIDHPGDSSAGTSNPLRDYTQPPPGLGTLAAVQFVLAGLMVLLGVMAAFQGQLTMARFALAMIPAVLLCAVGIGLLLRTAWGWWLAATIYYCVFFNLPVNLVLWTVRNDHFGLGVNLFVFGGSVVVLTCLTRPEYLRFIRFRTADGRPTRGMLLWPVMVGLVWATIRLVKELAFSS